MGTHTAKRPTDRFPRLNGKRFCLIPFREEHISDRYISWLNDPEVNRFLTVRLVRQGYESARRYVMSFWGDEEKYMWGIHPIDAGECVGTTTLYNINRYHGSAHFGLMIGDRAYWGSGASDEAMSLVAGFAFGELRLRRLTGGASELNLGMNFLFKRHGWTREGVLRKAIVLKPGVYTDAYQWGILAEEWWAKHGRETAR